MSIDRSKGVSTLFSSPPLLSRLFLVLRAVLKLLRLHSLIFARSLDKTLRMVDNRTTGIRRYITSDFISVQSNSILKNATTTKQNKTKRKERTDLDHSRIHVSIIKHRIHSLCANFGFKRTRI